MASTSTRHQRITVYVLLFFLLLTMGFYYLASLEPEKTANDMAVARMAWGLVALWVVVCGGLMYRFRERVREAVSRIPLDWRIVFVLFATALALVEEAIAVSMTNLAVFFGGEYGVAFITASTNYFELVALHSVPAFIPLFIAWALLLSRYDFSPFAVFILFGINGIISEILFHGSFGQLIGFAQWMFVYGLMVYLPAYCIPRDRGARPVRFYHYLFAVPASLLISLPLLLPIVYILTQVIQPDSLMQ